MWDKRYQDYPKDEPTKREQIDMTHGVPGIEMHELQGWGISHHQYRRGKKTILTRILESLFGRKPS